MSKPAAVLCFVAYVPAAAGRSQCCLKTSRPHFVVPHVICMRLGRLLLLRPRLIKPLRRTVSLFVCVCCYYDGDGFSVALSLLYPMGSSVILLVPSSCRRAMSVLCCILLHVF